MKIFTKAVLLIGLMSFASCQEKWEEGSVTFVLEEGEVQKVTKGRVSEVAEIPGYESFRLEVVNVSSGKKVFEGMLKDWKRTTRLKPGGYEAVVSCGSEEEGPGKPSFSGSAGFEISTGQLTEVRIKVTLANCVVRMNCSEIFKSYYPERRFTISTPYSPEGFEYEEEPIFVNWQFSVAGVVTNQAGKEFSLETKTWKGEPAKYYSIEYDVTNVGGVSITVTFDDTVQDVGIGEILIN